MILRDHYGNTMVVERGIKWITVYNRDTRELMTLPVEKDHIPRGYVWAEGSVTSYTYWEVRSATTEELLGAL